MFCSQKFSRKPLLYYTPQSPPCRAVLLTAAAIGIELDLRLINLSKGDHLTPEFLKLNPLHTLPVLADNGVIITDSHIICSYLVDKYSKDDSLYPKDKIKRMQIEALLYYDCGHLFPRGRLMVEPILFHGVDHVPPEKIIYMQAAYDGLEKCLANSKFLCGDRLTIADLCCIATVSTTRLLAPIEADKFPKVNDWVERLSQLSYYRINNQEYVEMMFAFILAKLEENKNIKQN